MRERLRAIGTMFRVNFAENVQYRASALAGLSIGVFWVLVEITMYRVFYLHAQNASAGMLSGLTLQQAIAYSWLAQCFFLMQSSGISGDIRQKIINGDVGVELCRPLPLYDLWLARTACTTLVPLVWRGSMTLIVGAICNAFGIGLLPPVSPAAFGLFLVSIVGAFVQCTSFNMLLTAMRMNLTWGDAPINTMALVAMALSGSYLPLQLWPEGLQRFLLLQPFAGRLDIPIRLYLGTISAQAALPTLLMQWVWIATFTLCGRALMARRIRGVIVQGG